MLTNLTLTANFSGRCYYYTHIKNKKKSKDIGRNKCGTQIDVIRVSVGLVNLLAGDCEVPQPPRNGEMK